ncbi:translation initiation factor eIF-2B subunit alpha isoform X2 [Belonocnema kinseyi]|uniref:translation initiation factor eIF-2B subunit alpha isoform X2 n=1 Tax=Belonocnema kinseyi TaxID=2817044 RepID=UPI00143E02D3|nr:translation initiation factor eIF-2B subunit alpha isoform X2 [Belonocnema kinseyi]
MEEQEICRYFSDIIKNEKDVSAGVAAIRTLLEVLEHSKSETVQELRFCLQNAVVAMRSTDHPVTAIASGSELFLRFITLATLDTPSFAECKSIMLHRGKIFYKKLVAARGKVAKHAVRFITDGCTILTHSKSRVVFETMKQAAQNNKSFEVYVTTSAPDNSGEEMCENLKQLGIPCTIIFDSAMGHVMERVDIVMVGAEGIAESGGIINKMGTFTMAVCAKEANKPFYVLTESFKFSRVYPLNQADLADEFKYTASTLKKDLRKEHPLVDYTPPHYINLLFTDLGILTPSAVSDELIKLYL